MQFSFSLNLQKGIVESEDNNFFAATELNKIDLINFKPENLFPDQSFYDSFSKHYHELKSDKIYFYNYLYTKDRKRIRVQGTAYLTESGYKFDCQRTKPKDATFTEFEKKNSLLSAINKSAELFLEGTNWKKAIDKTLDYLASAGDLYSIYLWRIYPGSDGKIQVKLKSKNSSAEKIKIIRVFDENQKQIINELHVGKSIINPKYFSNDGQKSEIIIPIKIDAALWGFIQITDMNDRIWNSDEIHAFESYAKILASAIRQYSLHKKLSEEKKKVDLITKSTQSIFYSIPCGKKEFDYISPFHYLLTNEKNEKQSLDKLKTIWESECSKENKENKGEQIFKIDTKCGTKFIQKKSYTWTNSKNETGELGVLQDVTNQNLQKQQLEKQNRILNALNRFTQVVLSMKDANHDLNKLLKYLGEASHCDRVFLFKKEIESNRFTLNAFWFGENDKLNDSIYEIEFNEDQLNIITEKLSSGKVITSYSNSSIEPKNEIIYPIFVNDLLEGFLGFDYFSETMNLTEAEKDALSISAKVIGASFELTDYIKELILAKKEAQKSDKLKSEFISQISHEIRSPLNIIMSFLGMIWEDLKDDDRLQISELYETIKKASNRLVRTIDLLIDASTIQSGTYEANFEKIDFIDEVIFPVVAQFRDISEKKKLLLLRESSSAERIIIGDKRSLSGVISHILDNAVKYTDEGYIKINDYNVENYLVVEITDSGKGISKQYLDNIFRPFTQEDEGLARSFDGLGLGMYIVKKYCELNDAEVSIDSKPSRGTKFTIKLPLVSSKKGNFESRES